MYKSVSGWPVPAIYSSNIAVFASFESLISKTVGFRFDCHGMEKEKSKARGSGACGFGPRQPASLWKLTFRVPGPFRCWGPRYLRVAGDSLATLEPTGNVSVYGTNSNQKMLNKEKWLKHVVEHVSVLRPLHLKVVFVMNAAFQHVPLFRFERGCDKNRFTSMIPCRKVDATAALGFTAQA